MNTKTRNLILRLNRLRFFFGINFLAFVSIFVLIIHQPSRAIDDSNQAKLFLKTYLKQLNEKYPFSDWEKQIGQTRNKLEKLKNESKLETPNYHKTLNLNLNLYLSLGKLNKEIQELSQRRANTDKLIKELYVTAITNHIDGFFSASGKTWDRDNRLAFQRTLMQYESGSLQPKKNFITNAQILNREYTALQTQILFEFAQNFLGKRVEDHLHNFSFSKIEALYDDYSLQLDYWTNELNSNAVQASEQLTLLLIKFDQNKMWLHQNLNGLIEVLNTDMLFSDLLEYAGKQQVDFTIEVEDKIENSLKESNQGVVAPIQQRILLWKVLAGNLRTKISEAKRLATHQKNQEIAREEIEKIEAKRMEALRAEQHRLEDDQKAKFKQTLTALKTFSFKTETSVELDDDAKKALSTKAGFLKTSYVRSGTNRLKVDKSKFSATLAVVEKFTVQAGQVDFSKMSLEERSNQSQFTYSSPAGRTSEGDLANFVSEVALGSFSSDSPFLSYVTPDSWSTGRKITWHAERRAGQITQDRDFSYVDMVVDAHRKKSKTATKGESKANLPANMILIFDPQGSIIRFETFSDINSVTIENSDLINGNLYFKFLNYSTDRKHIYLNGIDGELKTGKPTKK